MHYELSDYFMLYSRKTDQQNSYLTKWVPNLEAMQHCLHYKLYKRFYRDNNFDITLILINSTCFNIYVSNNVAVL